MSHRDTYFSCIQNKWNLESLDSFFNHPISTINPELDSDVVLKPAHYSDHLLKKLWAIARDTKVPPPRVRYLLALAVHERLEETKSGKRTLSITPRDADRVIEKLGYEMSRDRGSPELGDEEADTYDPYLEPSQPKEADTIIARPISDSQSPPSVSLTIRQLCQRAQDLLEQDDATQPEASTSSDEVLEVPAPNFHLKTNANSTITANATVNSHAEPRVQNHVAERQEPRNGNHVVERPEPVRPVQPVQPVRPQHAPQSQPQEGLNIKSLQQWRPLLPNATL